MTVISLFPQNRQCQHCHAKTPLKCSSCDVPLCFVPGPDCLVSRVSRDSAESVASVIAKFSLTNATYNFVLTIVPSFCLFNRNFPPNNPSAFSIFNSVSPSLLTAGTQRFCVGENTRSKQSCVNCVKIFYRINLGHINLID